MEGGATETDFDLLDHLVCLSVPERKASVAWTQHVPLGMLLVDLVQPTLLVELGASTGSSYLTFCQAVDELRLGTRCFAVDTWEGDPGGGCNSDDVFEDLKQHHDPRYGAFSTLHRSTFDDAARRFADRSIDFLHINGSDVYQAARHDVDTWLPKMSPRGVLVLHGINESESDTAARQLWRELATNYPSFEVWHGSGLGVVSVGSETPCGMQAVLSMSPERAMALRETLYALGQRLESIQRVEALWERVLVTEQQARAQVDELAAKHEARRIEAARQVAQAHQLAGTHIVRASLQVARARELAERQLTQVEDRARSEREELIARLAAAQNELAWQSASRGVRAVKLARASRAVLTEKGLLALAQRVGSWLLGKRGYYLRDIPAASAAPASLTAVDGAQVLD